MHWVVQILAGQFTVGTNSAKRLPYVAGYVNGFTTPHGSWHTYLEFGKPKIPRCYFYALTSRLQYISLDFGMRNMTQSSCPRDSAIYR